MMVDLSRSVPRPLADYYQPMHRIMTDNYVRRRRFAQSFGKRRGGCALLPAGHQWQVGGGAKFDAPHKWALVPFGFTQRLALGRVINPNELVTFAFGHLVKLKRYRED